LAQVSGIWGSNGSFSSVVLSRHLCLCTMGSGASAGIGAFMQSASADELGSVVAGFDAAARAKLLAALDSKPKVKIYAMPPSQNACGAVLLALDLGIGEPEFCDMMSGAHKKPEYLAIHPYGQIPGLKDGDFCLGESSAIMRYMAMAYGQKYYPAATSPQTCAKIDFAMDAFGMVYKAHTPIVYTVFGFGSAPDDQEAANKAYCKAIEKWLDIHVKDGKFVTGDFPSIADFKVAPFFYAAIQPAMKVKVGFEPPARAVKYCEDFIAAVSASSFLQDAGGYSIKEYAASKEK